MALNVCSNLCFVCRAALYENVLCSQCHIGICCDLRRHQECVRHQEFVPKFSAANKEVLCEGRRCIIDEESSGAKSYCLIPKAIHESIFHSSNDSSDVANSFVGLYDVPS